jgi:hypothetical protein
MAYFPNGSAGEFFMADYCCRCINFRERDWRLEVGVGCPVYDLHILLDQYGACNEPPSSDAKKGGLAVTKFVLDFLIEDKGGYRCSMFIKASGGSGGDGERVEVSILPLFPKERAA